MEFEGCYHKRQLIKTVINMFLLQALELQPGYKVCLVQRSKCYLRLGDPDAALRDAEESLAEDKEYNKVWKYLFLLISQHEVFFTMNMLSILL